MKSFRYAPAAFLLALSAPAYATLGVFEHGNGIKSMGMGGVGYSFAEETTVLAANPAHAFALGNRFDIGADFFYADAKSTIEGNDLAPDAGFHSDGREYYMIPQGGYSRRLSDRMGFGFTVLSAGLGPDYDGSPYQRFGGNQRVSMGLASSGVVSALAYQLTPKHSIGASLNVGYQVFEVKGLEFLQGASVAPDHVTNQGKDGSFTGGFTVGWHGQLTPWLAAGAAYRSKNWTKRHEEYKGLLSEGGKLELPAIYGGGFTLTPLKDWTFVLEAQRYNYRDERGFRNGLAQFTEQGQLLGSDYGPGFGWDDQNAYKFGVAWQATPKTILRAGYVYATTIVNRSDTFFAVLGCITTASQYSLGGTYQLAGDWEITGYAYNTPKRSVRGEDSIPEAFGGGEMNVSDLTFGAGFSVGKRFGGR